jgi:Tol biopolymer transport system component
MTAPDRIGQQLPELLTELAAPRVPDYVDDMLTRTRATSQLPAWASLERWLPMGAVARPAPLGLPSWRPILILVALVLTLTAATAFIAGSQPRVPAPFGPAANGDLLASTVDGQIVVVDPATGQATPRRGDGAGGLFPWFAADGTRYLFLRQENGGHTLYVANADGTGVRELLAAPRGEVDWVEWSPDGERVIATTLIRGTQQVYLIDPDTEAVTPLEFDMDIGWPYFRPNGTEIVFRGATALPVPTWAYYISSVDHPDPRPIIEPTGNEVFGGSLSPDGTTWAYSRWDESTGINGVIHLVDVETKRQRPVEASGGTGVADLHPMWSPDGSTLLVQRFTGDRHQNVLIPVDGTGEPVVLTGGPRLRTNDLPERLFSPDGSSVVMRFPANNSVWVYDTVTGEGTELTGLRLDGLSWQRVAR